MNLFRTIAVLLLLSGGAMAQGSSGPGGGMATSGSNATAAALDAIATAAGQTGGLNTGDSPTFSAATLTGILNVFDQINLNGVQTFFRNPGTGALLIANNASNITITPAASLVITTPIVASGLSTSGTIAGSVCATSGGTLLYESGATGCTISLTSLKNIRGPTPLGEAYATLAATPIDFSMKPRNGERVNLRPQMGFTAENVEASSPKCSTYDGKGNLQGYEPNCLLAAAYVVIKNQERRITRLERRLK